MIITLFLRVIIMIVGGITHFLPKVTELPWGVDGYLTTGVGLFYRINDLIPILGVVMQAFLIYLGYKAVMLFVKVIMGSRTPTTH